MNSISSHAQPVETPTDHLLAIALEFHRSGQTEKAGDLYHRILAREPANPFALHHLGLIAHQAGHSPEAAELLKKAVASKPDYFEALSNLCGILRALRKPSDSLAAGQRAIALNPLYAQAHSNVGNAYEDLGDLEQALHFYEQAAAIDSSFIEARLNAGNILRRLGRENEALSLFESLILKRPDAPDPYLFLGNLLRQLSRPNDAINAYKQALALRPQCAEAYFNLGNVLVQQTKLDEATEAYTQAIALRPGFAEAHANLGMAMETQGKVAEAIASYQAALALNPNLLGARCELIHQRRLACDWQGINGRSIEADEKELLQLVLSTNQAVSPFSVLSMDANAQEHLQISRTWAKSYDGHRKHRFDHAAHRRSKAPGERIRIAYVSADFHRHATAFLMAELFERHDRTQFELIAYSYGTDDQSDMRWRLLDAFERFVDIKDLTAAEAAKRIFDDEIDILIDLKGYTQHARNEIVARRPAPIQVSFIGYPGSMGADFIDYIIADPHVLPFDQQAYYDEKIVHLPHCYQPNDTRRRIADVTPTRTACGLPEDGFVFCCFNNSYKVTPKLFDIWMRLLGALPKAVLWLFGGNELVENNLRGEAAKRSIDPARLVFAPRLPTADHLARHRLADLFLDTLPYNAHTTASDALWAGLPVLTCSGETFAGRVAGSLLHAVGLPDLVTTSLEAYEALALTLARDPDTLFALRQKLLVQKHSAPLFDIVQYTQDLEKAYKRMWETWSAGEAPQAFAVSPAHDAASERAPAPMRHFSRIDYEACPLCQSKNIPQILEADCTAHNIYRPELPPTMSWHECGDCGHVFTSGYFGDDALNLLFDKTHDNQTVGHDMEAQRVVSARMVGRVTRHVGSSSLLGDWLDVGFGNGSLLFTAEEWGFRPVGIDLRKQNVEMLRKLGYEAHCALMETLPGVGRFSVISMADVLEHMPFPKQGLREAHRLLRPGGTLFLSMPNMDNMTWRLLDANKVNPYWGEIEHYHNFSRKRLYALLAEHGFQAEEYQISERYRVGMEVIARRQA